MTRLRDALSRMQHVDAFRAANTFVMRLRARFAVMSFCLIFVLFIKMADSPAT